MLNSRLATSIALPPSTQPVIPSQRLSDWLSMICLGESMLAKFDNLLLLHVLGDDLQNELFHHLSRGGGEVDWPTVSWDLLLDLFEDWSDTDFLTVLRHLSSFPWHFKDDGESLSNNVHLIPQHLYVHAIQAHEPVVNKFA